MSEEATVQEDSSWRVRESVRRVRADGDEGAPGPGHGLRGGRGGLNSVSANFEAVCRPKWGDKMTVNEALGRETTGGKEKPYLKL